MIQSKRSVHRPPAPTRKRATRSLVAVALAGTLLSAPSVIVASAASPQSGDEPKAAEPLDILVVNDDGWRGEGGKDTPLIVQLRNTLKAQGHRVTVVAPGTNQSGQGGRLSLPPTQLTVATPERDVWTVTPGSPSDSVFFAMDEIYPGDKPDLVISGMNPGTNLAQAVNHSGTVNAATTALEFGVPAMAISVEVPQSWPGGATAATPGAADYVAKLVDRINKEADGGPLMPDRTALNVNIPVRPGPIDPKTGQPGSVLPPKGERATSVGNNVEYGLAYENSSGAGGTSGTYGISFAVSDAPAAEGTDLRAVRDGYISLTPLESDRDVDERTTRWLRSLL